MQENHRKPVSQKLFHQAVFKEAIICIFKARSINSEPGFTVSPVDSSERYTDYMHHAQSATNSAKKYIELRKSGASQDLVSYQEDFPSESQSHEILRAGFCPPASK